jgi:hypothetical protein
MNVKGTKQQLMTDQQKFKNVSQTNEQLIKDYLEIATVTDDINLWTKLITDDCVFVLMLGGYRFKGSKKVALFAKTAGGMRTHNKENTIRITNWFTDGENLCVEYTHGFNSLLGLPIKVKDAGSFCLVFHMQDGKFDSIHEFIDTGGVLKSLLAGFFLGFIVWRTKMKSANDKSTTP